jgi:CelD/BcsL family acetyltransferase involved in cellulose biosynthesis
LKRALGAGLEVREEDEIGFVDFATLHAAMLSRKGDGASTDKVDLLPALAKTLAAPARPRLMMARMLGRPVAGAIFGVHGDTAYYLFGASANDALPLKAGYAVQWEILRALRSSGVHWYDLGGEAGEEGLRQFKKGLVGKRGTVVELPSEFEWAGGLKSRLALSALSGARRAAETLSGLRRGR